MILNQLLEEYKETENKTEFVNKFLVKLWNNKYTYRKYKKYYKYVVNENLLDNRQDLIDLFNKYSIVEYTVCKSFYSNSKIDSIDYIRIHINNMYGYLFDKEVYYTKKYYNLLLTPKKEYFRVIKSIKNGTDINYEEVKFKIEKAFQDADIIKKQCINKKYEMEFKKYKELINSYIEKLFNNYMSIEEYEKKHNWELNVKIDGWSEDNYVIKYFCKSLTGYMKNYIRNNKIQKYCILCNKPINNRNIYCLDCYKEIRRKKRKEYNKKYYNKIKNS